MQNFQELLTQFMYMLQEYEKYASEKIALNIPAIINHTVMIRCWKTKHPDSSEENCQLILDSGAYIVVTKKTIYALVRGDKLTELEKPETRYGIYISPGE